MIIKTILQFIRREDLPGQQKSNIWYLRITIVSIALTFFVLNSALPENCNTYSVSASENSINLMDYSELKEYEQELKADITQLKEELYDKEAYLASLDEELIRLELQYNKLLEERKRITDKLDSIKSGKEY